MTTLNLQVAASADDAHCKSDGADYSHVATTLTMYGGIGTPTTRAGMRFLSVTIDQAATITAAVLQVYCASSDDPNGTLFAEDQDNAATFSGGVDLRDRVITTASTAWAQANIGTGAFKDSPDIASAVQEVVDRAGWANGNALVIHWRGNSGGSPAGFFSPTSYNGSTSNCPKLSITYGGAALLPRMSLMGVG